MRLPLLDQADTKSVDIETVKKMVDAFLATGFSYFDTAACYHDGQSEIAFREAVVKRYPRENFTITDKLTMFMLEKPEEMPGFFAGQLERTTSITTGCTGWIRRPTKKQRPSVHLNLCKS